MRGFASFTALLATLLVAPCFAQTREKKAAPPDFHAALKQAAAAYDAKDYGAATRALNTARVLVMKMRNESILANMPAAPEGFVKVVKKKRNESEEQMALAMAGNMLGQAIEQSYRQEKGRGRINVSIVADSPLIKMLGMQFTMAKMNPDLEEIGYGAHKGLLNKSGKSRELSILISEKHLITVKSSGLSEEALFKMFNQAFVDKIAKQL